MRVNRYFQISILSLMLLGTGVSADEVEYTVSGVTEALQTNVLNHVSAFRIGSGANLNSRLRRKIVEDAKIATTKAQRKLFFNLRGAKKYLGWLSAAETEAIANDLGVSAREVTEMEKRLAGNDMAFDGTPGDDEERTFSPAQYLPNPSPDPAEIVEVDDLQNQATSQLHGALGNLDERSREILQARWLTDKKETLQSLAKR